MLRRCGPRNVIAQPKNFMAEFTLKQKINEDVKSALRSKETLRLETLRMLMAAIKQREVDARATVGDKPLDDSQVIAVVDKMIKQRQESIVHYQQGKRQDLVDKENAEIEILRSYMPAPLTEQETIDLIRDAIKESGAQSAKEMSKVITIVKAKAQGRVDMGKVSGKIKELLA